MTYTEIRKLLVDNELDCSIDLEIVGCVCASISGIKVSNKVFVRICECVRKVWDELEKPCTQTIADIVVDNIYNCYEYWNRKRMVSTEILDNIDTILKQYWQRLDY